MFDCTTDRYAALYSRWLGGAGHLLDLAKWEPGMKLLDLCGGTGAVTREAIRRGGRPEDMTILDLNPRWQGAGGVTLVRGRAEHVGFLIPGHRVFDVIVCRQAIAYLPTTGIRGHMLLGGVALLIKHGGRFVFNTFAEPRWSHKDYEHLGRRFTELSGYLGRRVFHVQWARGPGGGIDFTTFRWHDEDALMRKLDPKFQVKMLRTERSRRWVCTRRLDG